MRAGNRYEESKVNPEALMTCQYHCKLSQYSPPLQDFNTILTKNGVHDLQNAIRLKKFMREQNVVGRLSSDGRAIAGVWITSSGGTVVVIMLMIMTTVCYQTGYSVGKQFTRHDKRLQALRGFQHLLYNTFLSTPVVIQFFFRCRTAKYNFSIILYRQ